MWKLAWMEHFYSHWKSVPLKAEIHQPLPGKHAQPGRIGYGKLQDDQLLHSMLRLGKTKGD